jgi:P-type Mg2+ transporter
LIYKTVFQQKFLGRNKGEAMQVSFPSLFKLHREKPQIRLSMPVVEKANTDLGTLLVSLNTRRKGLTEAEAQRRLQQYGLNEVTYEKPAKWALLLLVVFNKPIIYILAGLVIVSYLTKNIETSIVLILLMVANGLLHFVEEYRSTQTEEELKKLVNLTATVSRRDKRFNRERRKEVPIKSLVPGDVIHLSAGDMIPADVRVLYAKDFFVSQADIPGEALSLEKHNMDHVVEKMAMSHNLNSTEPLDTSTVCFMGTNVMSGTAIAVVVATGNRTWLGLLTRNKVNRQVKSWNWLLISLTVVIVPVGFLINNMSEGYWTSTFLLAIAIAFFIPQLLRMLITINLAHKALAIAKQKMLIKRLKTMGNLGAMDILCTNKTGTLTQGKITLQGCVDIHGKENEEPLKYGYLNSYYHTGLKNLLDVALLKHVELKTDLKPAQDYCKVNEIPFDFVRRRVSVVLKQQQQYILICKGAVEEITRLCTHVKSDGLVVPMSESFYQEALQVTHKLNKYGLQVIAVAYKEVSPKDRYEIQDETNLTLIGYLTFLDSPNTHATQALASFQKYGVSVKVFTGDNDIVTRKICKQMGMCVHHTILGDEVESMSNEELAEIVDTTTVFAKMTPRQKARVVRILKSKGHTVGYIGDGINDAASLRTADIGVSVKTAVDVAKELADIILLEKNLNILAKGVVESRRTFGNVTALLPTRFIYNKRRIR